MSMLSSASRPAPVEAKKRYGLMKLRVGASIMLKGKDGIAKQYMAKEKRTAGKAKAVCICLLCKKDWATEKELLEAHPEEGVMVRQEEPHVYAWWSDEVGLLSDEPMM